LTHLKQRPPLASLLASCKPVVRAGLHDASRQARQVNKQLAASAA
jgi:hypothetical protein